MNTSRHFSKILIAGAEVDGRVVDVVLRDGRIQSLDPARPPRGRAVGTEIVEARGGALLPGLHDHHLHLLAMAAAERSVNIGSEAINSFDELAQRLSSAVKSVPDDEWVRVVGYHEGISGVLDRRVLDGIVGRRLVRVQHRSGMMWAVTTRGLEHIGIPPRVEFEGAPDRFEGIERDAGGNATGRLFRIDAHHSELWNDSASRRVEMDHLGWHMAHLGITGVTDATPHRDRQALDGFLSSVLTLPQKVTAMTGTGVVIPEGSGVVPGPVKVLLDDRDLPELDVLTQWFEDAHRSKRAVAVHSVSMASLALALAAWDLAGLMHGDRIEHGAVMTSDAIVEVARRGLRVVTQPCFVAQRGDSYLADFSVEEQNDLWRCRTLVDAGVRVAFGSDAPYGPMDPWQAIAAATRRTTPSGEVLGPDERLDAHSALARFLTTPHDPGGELRRIEPAAAADLCLLVKPLTEALSDPRAEWVRMSIIDGEMFHASA